jgi:hypothetical protein
VPIAANIAATRTSARGPRAAARRTIVRAVAAAALLLAAPVAQSLGRASLTVAQASGDGWTASGVAIAFRLEDGRLQLSAREARLPGLGPVQDLRVECARLGTAGGIYECDDATVSGRFAAAGAQDFRASFTYHSGTGALRLEARELRLAGGAAELAADLDGTGWRVRANTRGTRLDELAVLEAPAFELPAGFSLAGRADVVASVEGMGALVRAGRVDLALAELALASADGTIATDGLAATAVGSFASVDAGWQFDLALQTRGGQGYLDPVFLDFAALPFEAAARGTVTADGLVTLERFAARQPDTLVASGSALLDPSAATPLRAATVRLDLVQFPGAGVYVAPFLAGTEFSNATARGTLRGVVQFADGLPSELDVTLDGLHVDDPDGALAFDELAGRVRWYADETRTVTGDVAADDAPYVSTLGWRQGRLYGVTLGESGLKLTASGRSFRLLEPVRIPVLDGALRIDRLRMRHVGQPNMWLRLDAEIEPISMVLISKALDLPEFGGTFSGTIPTASLDDGVLTFGGNLEAQVFDGRITVRDVRLEEPLGRFPRLLANVSVDRLDLQQVTGTFSFGEITGRLSGEVNGLELFDWEPVRFDAWFATPPGDRSRRRISQRAIANISSIGGGGGVTAALQTGVLKFFEDFRYDRLGLSCRLENDVCRMSGVGPARGGGYYIVRGSGVPRIAIVGNGDRVAWSRLVSQLIAATESGAVEVR